MYIYFLYRWSSSTKRVWLGKYPIFHTVLVYFSSFSINVSHFIKETYNIVWGDIFHLHTSLLLPCILVILKRKIFWRHLIFAFIVFKTLSIHTATSDWQTFGLTNTKLQVTRICTARNLRLLPWQQYLKMLAILLYNLFSKYNSRRIKYLCIGMQHRKIGWWLVHVIPSIKSIMCNFI